jgi:signal transduction histidine kinase
VRTRGTGAGAPPRTGGARDEAEAAARAADARARAGAAAAARADAEALLRGGLRRALDEAGAERGEAWVGAADAARCVAAIPGPAPPELAPEVFAALTALPAASDLGAPELEAAPFADLRRRRLCATAPVIPAAGCAAAVILVGGDEPPGRVRPRTLAILDRVARHLAGSLATALAVERIDRLDASVRHLDRLAGLGALATEIVHEVRNPLVSVKSFLQLLPERIDDPEFRRDFLELATGELLRIERLLDVVLEHARPQRSRRAGAPTEPARCEPGEAIESVARLLAHRARSAELRLETEVAPGLPALDLDPDALRQVLLNLGLNALDATPSGGAIRLSARSVGRAVELTVDDAGPGVPVPLRGRIFEPFFSTKPDRPGGLGLAISRRIVEEAGGTLVARERPGGGGRFQVRLPVG